MFVSKCLYNWKDLPLELMHIEVEDESDISMITNFDMSACEIELSTRQPGYVSSFPTSFRY